MKSTRNTNICTNQTSNFVGKLHLFFIHAPYNQKATFEHGS